MRNDVRVRLSTKYAALGTLAGLVAPAGLFLYGVLRDRSFDPVEVFVFLAIGGVITFGTAGWMIGRRDDALRTRNQELKQLSESLHALSATDALTGIPNRRTLDDRLDVEVARTNRYRTPLSLVMIDIDHFKPLNDRLGHRAGDQVLRQLAGLLDGEKRAGDLIARYGGEEFVAILPHTDGRAAVAWAERARALIASTQMKTETAVLRVTASFGVAEAFPGGDAPGHLVEQADRALYAAKRRGRNRVAAMPRSPSRKLAG